MSKDPLIVKPDSYKPPLNVLGTNVTVLAANEETKGMGFTIQSGDSGTGPPTHSHDWDEAFFVLKGSVELTCNNTTETCLPGTFVLIPGGTVHGFIYGPNGGEMLEVTGHKSVATQLFAQLDTLVPPDSSDEKTDIEKVVQLMGEKGVTIHV